LLLPPPPPAEPLLALPEPAPDPDPGPEPLPAAPLAPLVPPLWPCVSFVTAAPVFLVFFFDLWVESALLSATPAADASLLAVCIEDELCDVPLVPLMLEDLLAFDDFDDLLLELSLGIDVLALSSEADALGVLVLELALPFRLEEPVPVLDALPLAP